jgi:hypothetical protein
MSQRFFDTVNVNLNVNSRISFSAFGIEMFALVVFKDVSFCFLCFAGICTDRIEF